MTAPSPAADPAQLAALREGAGLCDHGLRQVLAAGGADVRPWLERLVSLPVEDVAAPACLRTTFMDGKGKLRADPGLLMLDDQVLLDLPADPSGKLARLLEMFVINDDVQLAARPDLTVLTLAGPAAADALAALDVVAPGAGGLARGADELLVVPSALAPTPAWELVLPVDGVAALTEGLAAAGVVTVERPALDLERIRAGLPWWPDELSHEVIPLEARMEEQVSTTKGCYPGQEVVARIRNLGQVARRLERVRAPAGEVPAERPVELTTDEGKAAGLLTSVAVDPADGQRHGLAFLRRAWWKAGSAVQGAGSTWTVAD